MSLADSVRLLNSVLRTVILAVVVGALGYAGWFGYEAFQARQRVWQQSEAELAQARADMAQQDQRLREQAEQIEQLGSQLSAAQERIDQLSTSLALLKVEHRLAKIEVIEQEIDQETDQTFTRILFTETNEAGDEIDSPREFRLQGDLVYVDYWVVKFDDAYVERADLERSTSICLFRRLFGEHQLPSEGFVLDRVGSRPTAYAGGPEMSAFEEQIWSDFWNIAHDLKRAEALGIRAAHGEAVSTRLRPNRTYRLQLRASGGLSITVEEPSSRRPSA